VVLLQGLHEEGSEIIIVGRVHGVATHAGVRHHDSTRTT